MSADHVIIEHNESKDLEKLYKYFAYKTIQVIVQSRLGEKINTYSKPFAHGQDWFNISILNLPDVNEQIKLNLLISDSVSPNNLNNDISGIQKIINYPNINNFFNCNTKCLAKTSLNDHELKQENLLLKYPHQIYVEISLKTLDGDIMTLEVWNLSLTYTLSKELLENLNSNVDIFNSLYHINISNDHTIHVYRKMSTLLKSLITLSRVLPAYKISRQQNSSDSSFAICYRFLPPENFVTDNIQHKNDAFDESLLNLGSHPIKCNIGEVDCIPIEFFSKTSLQKQFTLKNLKTFSHTKANLTLSVYYRTDFTFTYPTEKFNDICIEKILEKIPIKKKMNFHNSSDTSCINQNKKHLTQLLLNHNKDKRGSKISSNQGFTQNFNLLNNNVFDEKSIIDNMFDPDNYVAPAFASLQFFQETFASHYNFTVDVTKLQKSLNKRNIGTEKNDFYDNNENANSNGISSHYLNNLKAQSKLPKTKSLVQLVNAQEGSIVINKNIEVFQPRSLPTKNFYYKPSTHEVDDSFVIQQSKSATVSAVHSSADEGQNNKAEDMSMPFVDIESDSDPLCFYHELQKLPTMLPSLINDCVHEKRENRNKNDIHPNFVNQKLHGRIDDTSKGNNVSLGVLLYESRQKLDSLATRAVEFNKLTRNFGNFNHPDEEDPMVYLSSNQSSGSSNNTCNNSNSPNLFSTPPYRHHKSTRIS